MSNNYKIINGNCLEVLAKAKENSVDSIVTDPPYGLSQHKPEEVRECLKCWLDGKPFVTKGKTGFMGKSWDAWVPGPEVWQACYKVLKPGGHMLVFAGTRSMDLMCMAIRLAGFELRDSIGYAHDREEAPILGYVYGSGMPKSLNLSKAIDRKLKVEPTIVGTYNARGYSNTSPTDDGRNQWAAGLVTSKTGYRTTPVTKVAKQYDGFGTQLKPALEPIILCRKPLEGTVAENVIKYGTGGINIDGCRIPTEGKDKEKHLAEWDRMQSDKAKGNQVGNMGLQSVALEGYAKDGRWPANVVLDNSEQVHKLFPNTKSGSGNKNTNNRDNGNTIGNGLGKGNGLGIGGDSGSAARFFYCAKCSPSERHAGLENPGKQFEHGDTLRKIENKVENKESGVRAGNSHPT